MEMSLVTVLILAVSVLHLALDGLKWLLYGSRAGVRAQ